MIAAVERNGEYLSHGRYVFLAQLTKSDGSLVQRSGAVEVCGDYFASTSVYDGTGHANSFVGRSSFGSWAQGARMAEEAIYVGSSARELRAGIAFGSEGPPTIRECAGGTGYQMLREFLAEQEAKGRIVDLSEGESPNSYVVRVYDSAGNRDADLPHYSLYVFMQNEVGIVVRFDERWKTGTINREVQLTATTADSGGFLVPGRIVTIYYGLPGARYEDVQPERHAQWTLNLELRSFVPLPQSNWESCDFDGRSLRLPPGVRLLRTNLDGSQAILEARPDGTLKPIEVLAPATIPAADLALSHGSLSKILRWTAAIAAGMGIVYILLVLGYHRHKARDRRL